MVEALGVEGFSDANLADSSRARMMRYLRYPKKGVDRNNIAAQSRINASYGLMQMMYETARGVGFPYNGTDETAQDNPEDLNVVEMGFKCTMQLAVNLLRNGFTMQKSDQSTIEIPGLNALRADARNHDWPDGMEAYYASRVYKGWNRSETYAESVKLHTQDFDPVP